MIGKVNVNDLANMLSDKRNENIELREENEKLKKLLQFIYREFKAYHESDGFMQEVWAVLSDEENKKFFIEN